jgi:hypothetical protein
MLRFLEATISEATKRSSAPAFSDHAQKENAIQAIA